MMKISKIREKVTRLPIFQKLIISLLLSLAVGLFWELGYEFNVQRKAAKGEGTPGIEHISNDNLVLEGAKELNNGKILVESGNTIILRFPERYINKFSYSYDSGVTFKTEVTYQGSNNYQRSYSDMTEDYSRPQLHTSVVNISDCVSEIKLTYYSMAEEKASLLFDFVIDNSFSINFYRIFFVSVVLFLILFFIVCGNIFRKKLELAFAVIGVSVGILFISLQPMEPISWDEAVHIHESFTVFESPGTHQWENGEYYLYVNQEGLLPKSPFLSKEEKAEQKEYLNSLPEESNETYEKEAPSISSVGYIFTGIGLKIADFLGFSFYTKLIFGKCINLLLYIFLVTMAIKILPTGKQLMAVIALMPTPMFQAGVYTYDSMVTGFLFLGTAVLVREFYYSEQKLKWQSVLVFVIAMILGCCPKAIYAPMIFIAAFLPKSKFKSQKQC